MHLPACPTSASRSRRGTTTSPLFSAPVLSVIGLAVVMFASTNVDDIAVLFTFLVDPSFRLRQIIAGQYIGLSALIIMSLLASLAALVLEPAQLGLVGLLPIVIGLKRLSDLLRSDELERRPKPTEASAVLSVAGVTIANGGDNISVYTPEFASRSAAEIAVISATFAVLTAGWLLVANVLVNHPRLGDPIRRYGRVVAPSVLVGLGIFILVDSGSLRLLSKLMGPELPSARAVAP